jgi:hypothetical protein
VRAQEPLVDDATTTERPEQPIGVREIADQLLRLRDLSIDGRMVVELRQRDRMREGMVADDRSCCPTTKNVDPTARSRRTSSTRGVTSGVGPLSKLRVTLRLTVHIRSSAPRPP